MSAFYTYKVEYINNNNEVETREFNTHLESKCFYELQENNAKQIKVSDNDFEEVLRQK